jgi:O-antigen ligase
MRLTPPRLPTRSVAAGILAVLVFWAPLPFGSVRPEDRSLLQLWVMLALLTVALSPDTRTLRPLHWVLVPFAGWVAWSGLQVVPLPASWLAALSPSVAAARRQAADLLGTEAGASPLSAAPGQTLESACWVATLLACFVVASLCGHRTRYRRLFAVALLAAALFQVLYGARRWGTAGSIIWGLTVAGGSNRLRGTYVNPDHLALLLELAICGAGALLWWALRVGRHDAGLEARLVRITLPLLLWVALFAALAFTGSRAGILAVIVGTLAQGIVVGLRRRRAGLTLAALGLVTLGVTVVSWIGFEAGWGRWLSTSRYELEANVRHAANEATTELWLQAPWTGVGLGAFRATFPSVQTVNAPGRWRHAHNDWLEALATTGVVGVVLVLLALGALGLHLHGVWRRALRSEGRAAALAGLGAMVSVGVHEALDFGLTIPANALVLAVVLGAASGARLRKAQRPAMDSPANAAA